MLDRSMPGRRADEKRCLSPHPRSLFRRGGSRVEMSPVSCRDESRGPGVRVYILVAPTAQRGVDLGYGGWGVATGHNFCARRDDCKGQRLVGRAERLAQATVGALIEQVGRLGVPL